MRYLVILLAMILMNISWIISIGATVGDQAQVLAQRWCDQLEDFDLGQFNAVPNFSLRVLMAYGLVLRSMNRRESRRTGLEVFWGALLKLEKIDVTGRSVSVDQFFQGASASASSYGSTYPFLYLIVLKRDLSISKRS